MWTIYFEKSKTQSDILKYSYESTLLCHLNSLWHLTINERNALFIIRLAGYVNMYDPMLERTEFANKKSIKISFYNIPLPEYWAQRILTHFTCKNQNVPFLKRIIDLPHSEKLGCLETSHSIVKFRVFLLCLFWALFQFVYSLFMKPIVLKNIWNPFTWLPQPLAFCSRSQVQFLSSRNYFYS